MRNTLIATSILLVSNTAYAIHSDRLIEQINKVDNVTASFEQIIYDNNREVLQQSSGLFFLDKEKGFKWVVNEPYSEEIIFDLENIYFIDPDLEQVVIDDISSGSEFLSIFFDNSRNVENFDIKELSSNTFEVKNKEGWNLEVTYQITFANNSIDNISIIDGTRQETNISFDNEVDAKIEDIDFNFEITDNFDVIISS